MKSFRKVTILYKAYCLPNVIDSQGYYIRFITQHTRNGEQMLFQCWPTVCDGNPTLNQHWSSLWLFYRVACHCDPCWGHPGSILWWMRQISVGRLGDWSGRFTPPFGGYPTTPGVTALADWNMSSRISANDYQSTRYIESMLFVWWSSVADDGPTLKQHWFNVSHLVESQQKPPSIIRCKHYISKP